MLAGSYVYVYKYVCRETDIFFFLFFTTFSFTFRLSIRRSFFFFFFYYFLIYLPSIYSKIFFFLFFTTFSLTFCLSIRRSSISSRLVGIEVLVLRIRVAYSVVDLSGTLPSVFLYSVIFVILSAGVGVTNIRSSLRSTTFEASGKFILSFVTFRFLIIK